MSTAPRPAGHGHLVPGNPGWDAARQAWSLAVDQRPAVIPPPRSAGEAAAAVTFARPPVTVRSTGRSHAGRAPEPGPHLDERKESHARRGSHRRF